MSIKVDSVDLSGNTSTSVTDEKGQLIPEKKPAPADESGEKDQKEVSGTSEVVDSDDDGEENADSEASQGEDEGDESEEQEEKVAAKDGKRKSGFKRRIEKLNKRVTERDLLIAQKDREIELLREQSIKSTEKKDESVKQDASKEAAQGRPRAEDFEKHEDYVEALTDWKLNQREKMREAEKKIEAAKNEYMTDLQKYQSKATEFKKTKGDWDEVVAEANNVKPNLAVESVILESENGPEVFYELAKSGELKRICDLPAQKAIMEMGKFIAKLEAKKESLPKKKQTTEAPPPPNTVNTGKATGAKKSLEEIAKNGTQAEYEAARAEQEKSQSASGW